MSAWYWLSDALNVPDIRKRALAKLQQLDAAMSLEDLRVPPSNRLEALAGDRQGQHSIRINKQCGSTKECSLVS